MTKAHSLIITSLDYKSKLNSLKGGEPIHKNSIFPMIRGNKLELEYPTLNYMTGHRSFKHAGTVELPGKPISLRFSDNGEYLGVGMAGGEINM